MKELEVGAKIYYPNHPDLIYEIVWKTIILGGEVYYDLKLIQSKSSDLMLQSVIGTVYYNNLLSLDKNSGFYVEFCEPVGHPLTKIFK
jgi:hypothetical protein